MSAFSIHTAASEAAGICDIHTNETLLLLLLARYVMCMYNDTTVLIAFFSSFISLNAARANALAIHLLHGLNCVYWTQRVRSDDRSDQQPSSPLSFLLVQYYSGRWYHRRHRYYAGRSEGERYDQMTTVWPCFGLTRSAHMSSSGREVSHHRRC